MRTPRTGNGRLRETQNLSRLGERRILRLAAEQLFRGFLFKYALNGACHYSVLALREHLGARYGVDLPVVVGYVRVAGSDMAWATHSWIELHGRKTDLALALPNPPVPAGDLVIDGRVVQRGRAVYYYALEPDDGVPTTIEASPPGADRDRRIHERNTVLALATAAPSEVTRYLAAAPAPFYANLQACWDEMPE